MGADAEESLVHDDKHRDVEDKVRGQIVEFQAVVVHEPRTKGWSGKPSPRRKWGRNTTLSWGLGVGMSCPFSGSRYAMSLDKYPAFLSFLMCPSVTEETIHLPPAPDMVGEGRDEMRELGRWSSSARRWISKGGRRSR